MADSDSEASSSAKGKRTKKGFTAKFKGKLLPSRKKEDIPPSTEPTGQSDDASEQASSVQTSLQTIKQSPNKEPGPIQELWNEAYEDLRIHEAALVNDYEGCLRGDLATMVGSTMSTSLSGFKTERREQMRTLLERKVEYAKDNTWKLRFAGQDKPVKDLAKPVVGIIRWADEYISSALDSNPYASIAWAGVGVLLPLLLNPSKQAASLAKSLEYISELIVRSKMREDLYERSKSRNSDEERKSSQNLDTHYRGTLRRLYIQILKFQANVIKHLSKNGASRLALDMIKWDDWDLGDVKEQEVAFCEVYGIWKDSNSDKDFEKILAQHREQIESLSSISYNTASTAFLLDAIRKAQADQQRIDLLNWLSSVEASKLYNSGRNKIRAGTGEWLLSDSSSFDEWKITPNSFIWLNGKAGSGKSVLSSSIIKHLKSCYQNSPAIAIAFFYFRFDDTQTQNVDEMLCSLIKQICAQRPSTPPSVQSLNDDKVKGHRPDRRTLENALVATVQGFDGVYVVLDALDECPLRNNEREELLKSIGRIQEPNSHNLHLLCTSRREADIERVLKHILCSHPGFDIDLSARKDAVDRDIGLHIDETLRTVEAFSTWEDEWKNEARTVLIDKADGMFQYVALQLQALKPLRDRCDIQEALRELPEGLDGTYNRILENIHPKFRKRVASTLRWIAFSLWPLSGDEVAEIFILDHEATVPFNEERRSRHVQYVLEQFSGLLTEIPQPRSTRTEIKFAHFSIKEYLSSDRLHEAQAFFSIHEQSSHLHISECCLAYHLHLSKTILATEETVKTYSLWGYAAQYWTFHLERVPRKFWTISVKPRMDRILETQSQALLNMVRVNNPVNYGGLDFEVSPETLATPLYYICCMGSTQIASLLIEQGAEVNEISPHAKHGTALQTAAYEGHNDIVKLLLEHGAGINMEAGYYGSALAAAASRGHIETVQLLLDHGANVNVEGGQYGSALAAAAAAVFGRIETVQLLLDHGANINAEGGQYGSALATAAYFSGTEIMQLLLDRGANVNAKGGLFGNALQVAIAEGEASSVALLLSNGAEIDLLRGQEWEELPKRLEEQGFGAEHRQKKIHTLRTYGENPKALIEQEREEREWRDERGEQTDSSEDF